LRPDMLVSDDARFLASVTAWKSVPQVGTST
jgi:hypothetical protein